MRGFDPRAFAEGAIAEIRRVVRGRALASVSGGVDSTTAAMLAKAALGEDLDAVVIDTGFLREGEAGRVARMLEDPLAPEVVDASAEFLRAVRGISDPEEKRRTFREVFYSVLARVAGERGARWLVQGTIAPDVIETVGGIKTQHNVLDQVGIRAQERYGFRVLEPLVELYKDQVRALAEYLGVPEEIRLRQPFPGPGLLIRCLGECTREKLELVRSATAVVEGGLLKTRASQVLAAVFDDSWRDRLDLAEAAGVGWVRELGARATGVKGDQRRYGAMLAVPFEAYARSQAIRRALIHSEPRAVRVLVEVARRREGGLAVVARAVRTEDFMTASPVLPPAELLGRLAEDLLKSLGGCSAVYYDVTPKPPATIEFE